MIEVAALTAGRHVPSARFRVQQYLPHLQAQGFAVHEYAPRIARNQHAPWGDKRTSPLFKPANLAWRILRTGSQWPGILAARKARFTWLQKPLTPGRYTLERALHKPFIFDVDDAIWLDKPSGKSSVARIAREASLVIVGNTYLADWFRPHARELRIIPTAIDCTRFCPGTTAQDSFLVGWTGSGSNLPYLYELEKPLQRLFDAVPMAKLRVIADRPPVFPNLPASRVEFVRWSPETEAAALQDLSVGIMPLPDTEWTRGKCSFKMLQYMACGLPVVVSPVGMNAEVLAKEEFGLAATNDEEWFTTLHRLSQCPEERQVWGQTARRVAEREFDTQVVAKELARVFQELCD